MLKIKEIISIFFENTTSPDTKKSFGEWLVDGENQIEKDKALNEIWEKIPVNDTLADLLLMRKKKTEQSKKKNVIHYLLYAAILIFAVTGTYFIINKQHQTEWIECFTRNGEHKEILLPDGTVVNMNSASVLLYPREFKGNERKLVLSGEALFEVKHNPNKPFIVTANNMSVEALGTVFNLESYPDSDFVKATLEEGKIRVNINGLASEILLPDQQIIYNEKQNTAQKKQINAEKVSMWKHGYLTFQSETFEAIIKTLERRFDIRIVYESEKYINRRFTMKFKPDEGIDKILIVMKETIKGFDYKTAGDIVYVK